MYVQKIDNKTNFKMAMKINPALKPQIRQRGIKYIQELEECGRKASDVKLYDVVLDESLVPQIRYAGINASLLKKTNDFFGELKKQESLLGKFVHQTCGDETHGYYMPKEPFIFKAIYGDKSAEKYAEFKKLSDIEKAVEYSRLLEEKEVHTMVEKERKKSEQSAKELEEKLRNDKLNRAVDELVAKYEYQEENVRPAKKSILKRLFFK